MKVHKYKFRVDPELWAYCGLYIPNWRTVREKREMATYWENVTCAKCLKKRPKKGGK